MHETNPSHPSNLDMVVSNGFGEHSLFAVNRNAFQRTDAKTVFRAYFGSSLFEENTFYVIVGTDSGLLYQHIKTQGVPMGSRYLFVELPQVLERLVEMNDPKAGLITTTLEEWMDRGIQEMDLYDYVIQDRVSLISSLAVTHGHYHEYLPFFKKIREELNLTLETYRLGINHRPFIICQLQNLAENQVPAICIKNSFQGKTAVVLAGGPSLHEMLPWVRQHRKDLLVVAVSRISYALINAGIQPDICISVDPYPFNLYVCKEMLAFQEGTLLVNEYHLSSNLLSSWGGLKVFTGSRYPWPTESEPEKVTSAGITVTNTAFIVAKETGVSQIILGGADFCFSQTGQTHASGSAEHSLGSQPMYGDRRVETNSGMMAGTDSVFVSSAKTIDMQAAAATAQGCRVINPSPNSVRLTHVEHISLDAIEIPAMEKSAKEIIAACLPPDNRDTRIRYYEDLIKEVTRVQEELRVIKALSVKALNYNRKLFAEGEKSKFFYHNAKLSDIEKQLNTKYASVTKFVKLFGLRRLAPLLRQDDQRAEDINNKDKLYFQAMADIATELGGILEKTRARILSRLEEEKPHPNLELLINQWRHDKQPGRAIQWAKHHPDTVKQLSETEQQALRAYQDSFEDSLKELAQEYFNEIEKGVKLDGLNVRAREYFQCRDKAGLQSLLTSLNEHRDTAQAKYFILLVQGYLAELQDDAASAIKAYQGIDIGPAQIDALVRLFELHIKANDSGTALGVLKTLSDISASYTPMYADMLEAMGDVDNAVEIYTDYLLANPDDLNSVMKLGKIYHKYGSNEGVEWAMNYILSKDPNNETAKAMLSLLDQSK